MKKALETEKKNYKAAELKVAEFKEELLNVKSERRKLSESLKVERQNGEAFEKELNVFKELKVNLEASVKDKDKQLTLKINDLKRTRKENDTINHMLVEIKNELHRSFKIKSTSRYSVSD